MCSKNPASGRWPRPEPVRLAVVQGGDVPADVPVRAARCLCTLRTCAALMRADLEAAEIAETRGADGGGHTFVATGRAELAGAISRPAEERRRAAS